MFVNNICCATGVTFAVGVGEGAAVEVGGWGGRVGCGVAVAGWVGCGVADGGTGVKVGRGVQVAIVAAPVELAGWEAPDATWAAPGAAGSPGLACSVPAWEGVPQPLVRNSSASPTAPLKMILHWMRTGVRILIFPEA